MVADSVNAGVWAYIGLGANLGDARATVLAAAAELAATAGVLATRLSPLYRTRPLEAHGPDYVNAVLAVHTTLSPAALWQRMQAIEQAHGRERPYRNAPRTLDLDLLLYNHTTLHTAALIVPHPRLHQRAFVLQPLADLAPDLCVGKQSVSELLQQADKSGLQLL